jgi:hypothetical protein
MVVGSPLSLRDLMTIQAIDVLLCMAAHLKFVNDRELAVQVALRALAAGPDEGGAGLFNNDARPARVNQIRRQDQGSGNSDRNKDGAEIHPSLNRTCSAIPSSCLKVYGLERETNTGVGS